MSKYKKNVGAWVQKKGVSFRVWAPNANSVALVGTFSSEELAMDNEEDGYWHTTVHNAKPGQEYKFVIHNGKQTYYRNDPRARHMTTSTGFSVIVDNYFDWHDQEFKMPPANEQVFYELHVGTFYRPDPAITGTFDDVSSRLDHLANLGINVIELMPITTMFDDRGWGYAPDYIYSIEPLYGGRYEFLKFVDEAHKRGIGVVLDVVYNHFSTEGLDMWQFDGWSENGGGGIYFYNDWRGDTPWGARPDYGRYEVRQYLLDNVKMWLEDCHIDGLRLDSTIYLRNTEGNNNDPSHDIPEAWQLLQEVNSFISKRKPSAISIAEDSGGNEFITKKINEGGAGFDAQWEVGFPRALLSAMNTTKLDDMILDSLVMELNRTYNGDPFQRVGFMDSHDSAANGSVRFNDDISELQGESLIARQRQIIAAGIVLTSPVIPMMLQGQEFQQTGEFNDWETLKWGNVEKFSGILEAHKHLISLRRNIDDVSAGLTGRNINISHVDNDNKVIVYHRWDKGGKGDDVVVVANFGNRTIDDYTFWLPRNGTWRVRFNSSWKGYSEDFDGIEVKDVIAHKGGGSMKLPASSLIIFSQDR